MAFLHELKLVFVDVDVVVFDQLYNFVVATRDLNYFQKTHAVWIEKVQTRALVSKQQTEMTNLGFGTMHGEQNENAAVLSRQKFFEVVCLNVVVKKVLKISPVRHFHDEIFVEWHVLLLFDQVLQEHVYKKCDHIIRNAKVRISARSVGWALQSN